MFWALGSASCDTPDETGGSYCYGHWVLCLVISHPRQGIRFFPGTGLCVLRYHTRDRGNDLLRALGSASCDITYETTGYGLLRALGSSSCDITPVIGGIRLVTGIRFCVL